MTCKYEILKKSIVIDGSICRLKKDIKFSSDPYKNGAFKHNFDSDPFL